VLRTVQTARLMAGRGGALELREEEALAVDQPARGVLGLIEANRERGYLVVVGHNPTLENVAAAVAPGMKGRGVNLRTGECLVFEVPEGQPLSKGTLVARWRLDEEDD
jgi:phosphohistidine phosphatase SixA